MNQHKMTCWFAVIVKVVATFLIWSGIVIASIDEAGSSLYSDSVRHYHQTERIKSHKSAIGGDSFSDESFPVNKPASDSSCDIFYILVSTIDGKVSALDLRRKGSLVWSVQADTRPLYSSSLASMEMIHSGKKMRLIPSLDGALYQFDGDKVEAVPLSAETLLSSTYRLSDDSMIVGSKDMKSFGINLHTGELQFTCGSDGCSSSLEKSEGEPSEEVEALLLTRSTQVVRCVDIKNGHEKWNFSVGQHQIRLLPATGSEIDDSEESYHDKDMPAFTVVSDDFWSEGRHTDYSDYENLQVLVPEGRIVALSKRDPSQVLWEYKFESPVAKAWLLHHGKLRAMSLFDGQHIPTLTTYIPTDTENESVPQPLLYIGSHNKLLYIQASPHLETVLKTFTKRRIGHFIDPNIRVSWRPYLNTASVRTPIFGGNRPQLTLSRRKRDPNNKKESTSLVVWHEDYPFDTGYFLYPEFLDARSVRRGKVMLIEDMQRKYEEGRSWFQLLRMYWREMLFFGVLALIVQILLARRYGTHHRSDTDSSDVNRNDIIKNSHSSQQVAKPSDLDDGGYSSGEYVSRFATDFDCLHCLGKGGFGVVFEAVNRVDDQHYAIKRTVLPKSEEAKEKVLREVKALAKLDHVGIVRYFNAWVESPPVCWQEERDKQFHFTDNSELASSNNSVSLTEQSHFSPTAKIRKNDGKVDVIDRYPYSYGAVDGDPGVFSSYIAPSVHQIRQSGSGEFSVHSDYIETSDDSENESIFTYQSSVILKNASFTCDNNSFCLNSASNSSAPTSVSADQLLLESTGHSVVFENTNIKQSQDSVSKVKTGNCSGDIAAFKKSFMSETCDMEERNKQHFGLDDHCSSELELRLRKNDDRNEKDRDGQTEQIAHSGTKFFLYIQMQLYQKETLKDWLSSNTLNRDRHTVLDILDQIVCAVEYIHSQGLMHRDLKPSNIFFAANDVIKVGDFGLVTAFSDQQEEESEISQKSPRRHTAEVGTTMYMSPEQIARKPYDLKIDIFSLGLILLELLIPFSTQMERIRTLQDAKRQVFPARFIRELPLESELVCKMTSTDPTLRPTAAEILEHPLLQQFAPTRLGARHRRRTVSSNSIS